jgi:hypothetical protein
MKAFPALRTEQYQDVDGNWRTKADDGMDLRDYFAAKAMMIAIRLYDEECMEIPYIGEDGEPMNYEEGSVGTWFPHTKQFGETCYAIADAMMEARTK